MQKFNLTLFFLIICCFSLKAQFSDSIQHHISFNASGNINKTDDGVNYLFNNGLKYKIQKDRLEFNLNSNWIYGENASKLTNNDFKSGIDFNVFHDENKRFNSWGLANYISSFSLKINHQYQGGIGLAYKLIDRDFLYLRISDGILFEESSIIKTEGNRESYHTFRNSLRIQWRMFYKRMSFESTAFWQPSLSDINDHLVLAQIGIGVKINNWLSFNTGMNYNYVSLTEKENILFTYGLSIDRFF